MTEREKILLQREAAVKALKDRGYSHGPATDHAQRLFPLPTVSKPREVIDVDNYYRYRINNGSFEYTTKSDPTGSNWHSCHFLPSVSAVKQLIDSPTVQVESDC